MITGYIDNEIPCWYPEALKELLYTFKNTDFQTIEKGKHRVKGDDIFFMVQDYETRSAEEALPEDHQIYADVQFVFEGEEYFGVTLGNDGFKEAIAYDVEKDIRFYEATNSYGQLHFKKGMYILVMPEDVHVPALNMPDGSRNVRKIVGKIKVALLKI